MTEPFDELHTTACTECNTCKPSCQNYSQAEFIAKKDDHELTYEEHLCYSGITSYQKKGKKGEEFIHG
jgi:hypothetical protein